MLSIPFIETYFNKVVGKERPISDSVDLLNHYGTALLLAIFAIGISTKQYFGNAINCWTPNEFKGSWDRYTESYCFVANSYYVPYDDGIPELLGAREKSQISYYRWIPVVLAIQSIFFWLPSWIWSMAHKQTAINPRSVVSEALKCRELGAEREQRIEGLANFVLETLSQFAPDSRGVHVSSGCNATLIYLFVKFCFVLNCFAQLALLNIFLGGDYYSWAYETLLSVMRAESWKESPLFPRVIMCDFTIRQLGNPHQRHTVQCVMMLNMINEKLYFFLYFWLLLVGIVTAINFLYYLVVLSIPFFRVRFVLVNINKTEQKERGLSGRELRKFVDTLKADGILLLHFIRQHIGGRLTYDLLNELIRVYWLKRTEGSNHTSSAGSSSEHTKLSFAGQTMTMTTDEASQSSGGTRRRRSLTGPTSGKNSHYNDELTFSRQNTYKPTHYGPAGLLYPASILASPNWQQRLLLHPELQSIFPSDAADEGIALIVPPASASATKGADINNQTNTKQEASKKLSVDADSLLRSLMGISSPLQAMYSAADNGAYLADSNKPDFASITATAGNSSKAPSSVSAEEHDESSSKIIAADGNCRRPTAPPIPPPKPTRLMMLVNVGEQQEQQAQVKHMDVLPHLFSPSSSTNGCQEKEELRHGSTPTSSPYAAYSLNATPLMTKSSMSSSAGRCSGANLRSPLVPTLFSTVNEGGSGSNGISAPNSPVAANINKSRRRTTVSAERSPLLVQRQQHDIERGSEIDNQKDESNFVEPVGPTLLTAERDQPSEGTPISSPLKMRTYSPSVFQNIANVSHGAHKLDSNPRPGFQFHPHQVVDDV